MPFSAHKCYEDPGAALARVTHQKVFGRRMYSFVAFLWGIFECHNSLISS